MLRVIVSLILLSQVHAIFLGEFCTVVYERPLPFELIRMLNEHKTAPLLQEARLHHPEATAASRIERNMFVFVICYPHLDSKCGIVLEEPLHVHRFQSDKFLELHQVPGETLKAHLEDGKYVLRSCREIHEISLMERLKSYFNWES